jgi:hypothetical protein
MGILKKAKRVDLDYSFSPARTGSPRVQGGDAFGRPAEASCAPRGNHPLPSTRVQPRIWEIWRSFYGTVRSAPGPEGELQHTGSHRGYRRGSGRPCEEGRYPHFPRQPEPGGCPQRPAGGLRGCQEPLRESSEAVQGRRNLETGA